MMKLSEVLDRYYVLPFGQSELVGWHEASQGDDPAAGLRLVIEWTDSEDMECYTQEFYDQPLSFTSNTTPGLFTVTTTDGDAAAFIALTGANLEDQ